MCTFQNPHHIFYLHNKSLELICISETIMSRLNTERKRNTDRTFEMLLINVEFVIKEHIVL